MNLSWKKGSFSLNSYIKSKKVGLWCDGRSKNVPPLQLMGSIDDAVEGGFFSKKTAFGDREQRQACFLLSLDVWEFSQPCPSNNVLWSAVIAPGFRVLWVTVFPSFSAHKGFFNNSREKVGRR